MSNALDILYLCANWLAMVAYGEILLGIFTRLMRITYSYYLWAPKAIKLYIYLYIYYKKII